MFFKQLRLTLAAAKKNDPSAPSKLTILLSYPGVHALMYYRVAHFFNQIKWTGLARIISNMGRTFTNIDIHPGAQIGKGLFIDHGAGVVIGQTAVIKDNVVIFHGVTLGSNSVKSTGNRHPNIGNNVTIYANSVLVGNITIGDNSIIGANSMVKQDIPNNSVVVGNPMRFISIDNKRIYDTNCECEIMRQELENLKERLNELQARKSEQ
ncbi:MAG: serine O-acetyltransferase EpsC [Acholeplasma sp.]|jgi:serine O-acetyltransferase|nr:serine O-acetyltransferase EpsC [Acholeplasma sp.]